MGGVGRRCMAVRDAPGLTRGERHVARLYATGHTHGEIAEVRGTQEATVSALLCRAARKLGVPVPEGNLAVDSQALAGALTGSSRNEEPPLTPAQKLYLQAFDRYLAAWRNDGEDERRARLEMRYMLGAMYLEARVPMPSRVSAPRPQLRVAA
jgi:DNA-binding CsgD family transcriptional regulator